MIALAINGPQLEPLFARELRIEREHFDGEGDFVGHTLAVWLRLAPQFQILRSVIVALAVLVMHLFVLLQGATKKFFYHMSMLVDECALGAWVQIGRDRNPDVSVLSIRAGCGVWVETLWRALASVLRSAFRATQFFLSVDRAAGASLDRHRLAALNAVDLPLSVGKFAALATATARAVLWVFAPLFAIGTKFAGAAYELSAACCTVEFDAIDSLLATIMDVIARLRAEFSIFCRAPLEGLAAILAGSHFDSLSRVLDPKDQYHGQATVSTLTEGVA